MNQLSASEWEALSALFDEADELDEVALADWLEKHRRTQNPLLPHLERMLEARTQVKADAFIERPAGAGLSRPSLGSNWAANEVVGAYTLIRQLGRGGMAEVWLAVRSDGAFERNVAIKLLYGDASSRRRNSFVQRFDRERDILASLNHPHIAKLLDAGITPSGQPWIALEFVQGSHLTDYCDSKRLNTRSRVELFLQVLQAVQYAHANLVIHRDLKPPNILVTEAGQVQLLDFGIAKIIESSDQHSTETELTQQAGRPLTLMYASPEQTRGEPLTVASDVYALGVVLYQLVCGESPYELKRESAAFLEHAIQEVDPRPPSRRALTERTALARSSTRDALRRALGNDLDAIILKALHKQPEQRYSSAEALLLDLRRWLDGQAVLAKPPSRTYYLRKFVTRHALGVSMGAAGVIALLVVSAVAIVFGIQANRQSERAKASRDFMIEMFRQADPEIYAGREITAKELVTVSKSTLFRRLADQPQLQAELLYGLGMAQYNMAQYLQSDVTLAESIKLLRQLDLPRELAEALISQSSTVYLVGDWARAKGLLEEASKVARIDQIDPRAGGKYHELMALYVIGAQNPSLAVEHAEKGARLMHKGLGEKNSEALRAQVLLARVQMAAGQYDAARKTLAFAQEWVDRYPEMEAAKVNNLQSNQAQLESLTGSATKAERMYDAVSLRCEATQGPTAEDCNILRHFQAKLLLVMGHYDKALKVLPNLLVQVRYNGAPRRQAEMTSTAAQIIFRNQQRGNYQDVWDQLVALSEADSSAKIPVTFKLQAMAVRVEELLSRGQVTQANSLLERGRAGLQPSDASLTPVNAQFHTLQGIADTMAGRYDSAGTAFEQARSLLQTTNGPTTYPMLARANAAVVLAASGKTKQAHELLASLIDTMRLKLGANSPMVHLAESKLQAWSGNATTGPLTFADFFN